MLKLRSVVLGAAVAATLGLAGAAEAALSIVGNPVSVSATSEHSAPFAVTGLFDGTVTPADLDVTDYGGTAQWAGVGPGPHTVFMDFGSTISANGLAYAQRQGDASGTNDKVGSIELWFSDTDFGGVVPGGPADATVIVGSLPSDFTNGLLESFSLGGTHSGQFVAARFNALDLTVTPSLNNIGGSEFRLFVPEPASIALLGLGGLMMLRRRRA